MNIFRPGERTLAEIIADLSQPIPQEYLREKKKGGATLTIFEWMTAQRFLDWHAPGWHGHATLTYSNERVGCVYEVCIPTSDAGLVCRSASGDDSEDDDETPLFANMEERKKWEAEQRQRNYGSPTTRAEGQAFKRAATRFGFGLYLRNKGKPQPQAPQRPPASGATAEPHATPDQIIMIRNLAAKAGISLDTVCKTMGVKVLPEMTEAQAIECINRLQARIAAQATPPSPSPNANPETGELPPLFPDEARPDYEGIHADYAAKQEAKLAGLQAGKP